MGFAVPARAVTGKASSSVRGSVRPFFEFIHGIQVPPSLSLRNTDLQVRVDIRHSELCILHHRWMETLVRKFDTHSQRRSFMRQVAHQ